MDSIHKGFDIRTPFGVRQQHSDLYIKITAHAVFMSAYIAEAISHSFDYLIDLLCSVHIRSQNQQINLISESSSSFE